MISTHTKARAPTFSLSFFIVLVLCRSILFLLDTRAYSRRFFMGKSIGGWIVMSGKRETEKEQQQEAKSVRRGKNKIRRGEQGRNSTAAAKQQPAAADGANKY